MDFQSIVESAKKHAADRAENPALGLAGLPKPRPREIPDDLPKARRPPTYQLSFWDPSNLPRRPYCTDDPTFGVKIRSREQAMAYPLIQVNNPAIHWALVLDMDRDPADLADPWKRPGPAWEWESAKLPAPTWIAVSRTTASCHYGYKLAVPVALADCARPQPLRYLAAVERSYLATLQPYGADPGFSGLITRNPESQAWKVWASGAAYSLGYLAQHLPRIVPATEVNREVGVGRHVTLFDELRAWAYRAIRDYREDRAEWLAAVHRQAAKLNTFQHPLPFGSIRATAKSVGNWVWKMDPGALRVFISRQSWRGRGGYDPAKAARLKSANAGRKALGEPWKAMGISRRTYFRRKKAGLLPRTDPPSLFGIESESGTK